MTITRQGLLQLGSTVFPVEDVTLDPALATQARASSGDEFPTAQTVFGGVPTIQCSMPVDNALDDIGLTVLKVTTLELSLLNIDSSTGKTASGTSHPRISLATSCSAYVLVNSISASQGALATAQVTIFGISNDGDTDPFEVGTGAALALASQPTLHTMGPVDINGSEISGATGINGSLNHDAGPRTTDGDLYPSQFSWRGCNPVMNIEHSNPAGVLSSLGLDGASITSATKVTLRERAATGVISSTEKSITIGAGYILTNAISGGVGRTASTGMTILPASSDGTTHPWTLGT